MRLLLQALVLIPVLGVASLVCSSPPPMQTTVGALTMHATIESVGVVSPYEGDENQNNSATIWYRPVGGDTWMAGPEMVADRPALEWRVSLVYLSPDTAYEVNVGYTDPDEVFQETASGSIRTRPDYPDTGAAENILYVPDDGELEAVIGAAVPGDTIRIREGVYYTTATLEEGDSGQPGAYLTIEAVPGAQVILDGSAVGLNDPATDNWLPYGDEIYYTDLPWGDAECDSTTLPGYVGEQRDGDGIRYLLYLGVSEWDGFLSAPPGSAYYDCQGRLYVVTYDSDDPDNHEMHVSRQANGLVLAGADYVRIRGLEFRYYGSYAIYLTRPGADHNVIEGNTFHGIGRYHIRVGYSGEFPVSANLIQDNHFYERGYRDGGWTWRQQHDHAGSVGVRLHEAGPGNVIRRNTFDSGMDAIGVVVQSHDTDVHGNVIEWCMDDGIEVDNEPGYNIRVWDNTISHCYSGISNQDWFTGKHWNSGPVYIFRNVVRGGDDPLGRADFTGDDYVSAYAFKVGTDEDYFGRVYYYHNTIYFPDSSTNGNGVQDAGGEFFSGVVARNNIWSVTRKVFNLRRPTTTMHHDLDCDNLHNSGTPTDSTFVNWSDNGGPEGTGLYRNLSDFQAYTGQELRGISDNGTRFSPDLSLLSGSPEIDAGCVIVGFNDRGPWAYTGDQPDIGAFEWVPQPDLSASAKTASTRAVSTGDRVTYTVLIRNTGIPLFPTLAMTDMLPVGLEYLPGTLTATLGTAWTRNDSGSASIHWQGVMSDTPAVEIQYAVQVDISETLALVNTAWIGNSLVGSISRSAIIIVNAYPSYLPVIFRHGQLLRVRDDESAGGVQVLLCLLGLGPSAQASSCPVFWQDPMALPLLRL